MASQTHFIHVFVILFVSLNLFSLHMVSADQQLVTKVCEENTIEDTEGCLKILSPQASKANNINQLVEVSMKQGAEVAQKTLTAVEELKKKPTSPAALTALQICTEVYSNCVDEFKIVGPELRDDPMSANYDVAIISPEIKRCVDALETARFNAPELVQGNLDLYHYAALGYEMTVNL
ncbi:hypothetical protein F3Y22_tig00110177pilonHSYRG00049 [Hibiscus syriacus]|uniref:Pectinesterase inhibitor domain-containing protein n=1 Tax=Hibiscus syriacus TaxID=106335 RepID=A0A6A3BKG0_HIBSY|nr:hypothetical protein F3Y22_tig00110177pilonHSYRG00049 [Hibiscus syriacus]